MATAVNNNSCCELTRAAYRLCCERFVREVPATVTHDFRTTYTPEHHELRMDSQPTAIPLDGRTLPPASSASAVSRMSSLCAPLVSEVDSYLDRWPTPGLRVFAAKPTLPTRPQPAVPSADKQGHGVTTSGFNTADGKENKNMINMIRHDTPTCASSLEATVKCQVRSGVTICSSSA